MKRAFLFVLLFSLALSAGELQLVRAGKAQAVIVLADQPTPASRMAAEELKKHVALATGAELAVVPEKSAPAHGPRIFIGSTRAAQKAGLGHFDKENWRILAHKGDLYFAGGENDRELVYRPELSEAERRAACGSSGIGFADARRGPLYAVVHFLENTMGIRWLWPGPLGTVVPKRQDLSVPDTFQAAGKPYFAYRKYRCGIMRAYLGVPGKKKLSPHVRQLAFSPQAVARYVPELQAFLLRYQMGDSQALPAPASHLSLDFWKKTSKKHPEWFAMHDDGVRGAHPGDRASRLCVSEPSLAQHWVDIWDGSEWIGLGEGDIRTFCRCPRCMEWDKPQPENFPGYSTSNRYLKYAERVRALAQKRNPDVKISVLLYMDYIMPPAGKPDLSWMFGKFVPWGGGVGSYYPMTSEQHKELLKIWRQWQQTGIRLHYRPNYLLAGYTMPFVETRQCIEMLKYAGTHSMEGFDYDSLLGYWSTMGPMLYLHMRLGTNPELDAEKLLKEYYSAFGPAENTVRKYFDYWEDFARKLPGGAVTFQSASSTAEKYPLNCFDPAQKLLTQAKKEAERSADPAHKERVEFLQLGLSHAKLCAEFSHLFRDNQFTKARKKLDEIVRFRRAHENTFFTDCSAAAGNESKSYVHLEDFMAGKFRHLQKFALQKKGFRKSQFEEISGLKPQKWGLSLSPKAKQGFLICKVDSGEGNSHLSAELSVTGILSNCTNRLEISPDKQNWQTVAENFGKKKIDITPYVKGQQKFFLRISCQWKGTAPKEPKLALAALQLTAERKNPEKTVRRPKLELGTGWIPFTGDWFFRKDVKGNLPLPQKISGKEWKKVPVPARLSRTAVGPYLGYGYYAVEFTIPGHWAGRSADLLVGAVDEQAWVYCNGKKVGEHSVESEKADIGVLWNEPFIVRIPDTVLKPGEKNFLVIRTHASKGEHGIWQPVQLRPVDASAL